MAKEYSEATQKEIKKLAELIKGIRFTMMTTVNGQGNLCSRPMTVQELEFDGNLWFFTGLSTSQAKDIQQRSEVNLALADHERSIYISMTGKAELVNDRDKARELWNPAYKAWFPLGLEDPELILICVNIESAELWESPSSKLVQAYAFAKAILTGTRAGQEMGTQEHIEFRH